MMRALISLLFSLSITSAAQSAEVPGRQAGDATMYRVDGFDSIALATPASVEVRVGPAWSVRAFGPAEAVADLRVEREGGSLRLRARDGWRARRPELERKVRVLVTLPRLSAASVAGSGHMIVDRVGGARVSGSMSGAGSLALGTLAVGELTAAITGSGTITASGTARRLAVNSSGSGDFRAPGLRVNDASVVSAGSGSVRTIVQDRATVSLAGSGFVDLGRRATCTVRRVGSGRVVCGS